MEWLIGSIVAVAALVLSLWQFGRERRKDELIQWVVDGEPLEDGVTVAIRPIGGDVIDVRVAIDLIGGHIDHAPLARAEWPVERPKLELTFTGGAYVGVGPSMFARIIWRSKTYPRARYEEWFPVMHQGRAAEILLEQTLRSPLHALLLRVSGAPVLPSKRGISKRRVSQSDIRRELRKVKRDRQRHS